jgi:hypothetical protein
MSTLKAMLVPLAGLVIILLLWNFSSRQSAPPSGFPSAETSEKDRHTELLTRIDALEGALFEQQVKTRKLDERIAQLEQPRHNTLKADGSSQTSPQQDIHQPAAPTTKITKLKRPPTLQQKLLDAGLAQDTVERISQHIGENRLALLELRNRAIREDWMDTPEYIEQLQQLGNPAKDIREQEGDTVYDQYLYAAGRPNRVMVTEVYPGSMAQQAGIQPHDVILSYAQKRVFSMRELQRATTEGIDGEMVLMELSRDGQRLDTSVERGPLGIALTVTRMPAQ